MNGVSRVLLVGCRPLLYELLAHRVADATDLRLVGKGRERDRQAIIAQRPDVVMIDCRREDPELLALGDWLQGRGRAVVFLIGEGRLALCRRLLGRGAAGCLTSACSIADLLAAVRAAANGGRYLPVPLARALAGNVLDAPHSGRSPFEKLSGREWQVMWLMLAGHRAGRISTLLALSPKTISTYRSRIFDKLAVDSDASVVRLAYRHGLLGEADAAGRCEPLAAAVPQIADRRLSAG